MRIRIEIDGKPLDVKVLNDVRIMVFHEDFVEPSVANLELVYKITAEGQSIDLVDLDSGEVLGETWDDHFSIVARHAPNGLI